MAGGLWLTRLPLWPIVSIERSNNCILWFDEVSDPRVEVAVEGPLAVITLRRPEKQNAIDQAMIAALEEACDRIEPDPAIRVVILAAEGKAFSSGGDIKAWSALRPDVFAEQWVRRGHRAMDRLARLAQPVIAVLAGSALGGGLELAAAADLRIAEAHAEIGMPETSLGMVPGWSGTQRLVRRFGGQAVRRMVLGGDLFAADEALALGLVDRVVPTGEGLRAARELASKILRRGPLALRIAKQMIAVADGEERDGAVEALASAFIATTGEMAEGVAAFRQKRPPSFDEGEVR